MGINHDYRDGRISLHQAHYLHAEDRMVRHQERFDARFDHGHITRADQRATESGREWREPPDLAQCPLRPSGAVMLAGKTAGRFTQTPGCHYFQADLLRVTAAAAIEARFLLVQLLGGLVFRLVVGGRLARLYLC